MAKQAGDFFIEGTIDDLTYYRMNGRFYVRGKSSLTKKKFWRSKAFERSRESCKRFSEGNKLASRIYRMIEKEKRVYSLYCFLKKRAISLLKEGKSLKEAEEVLIDYLRDFRFVENSGETKELASPEKKKDIDHLLLKEQGRRSLICSSNESIEKAKLNLKYSRYQARSLISP